LKRGKGTSTTKTRRRKPVAAVDSRLQVARHHRSTDREETIKQLRHELDEARQQQGATADVLKVISRSDFDLHTILQSLVDSAARLCDADKAFITRQRDGAFYRAEAYGFSREFMEFVQDVPVKPERGTAAGRALLEHHVIHIFDVVADPEYTWVQAQRLGDFRTILAVPMVREGTPIGVLILMRSDVRPFAQRQIELVTSFADQAAIAINNVHLFDEVQARTRDLTELLQQQTATADVLKVISRSAFNLQAVLSTLTESAAHLCEADMGAITRQHPDGGYHHATRYNFSPEWEQSIASTRIYPDRGSLVGRVLLTGQSVQIPDVQADAEYAYPEHQRVAGYRTLLGVPLLRSGQPTGVLFLGRKTVQPFTDRQVELVQTFADQAVIAIENVRLFDEVQARTDDLSEALQQQTATGDVLKVIASSPTDVEPALQAIVESACAFCNAYDAGVLLKIGDDLHFSAHHGPIRTGREPRPISREWVTGRSVVDKLPIQVSDFWAPEAAEFPEGQRQSREQGHRCTLSVPLLREGEAIGALALRRLEPVAFSDKQVALLQTFADQAVIAIGNVRLFDEVQAKTRDLSEALTYQTGSATILKVIASSPTDVDPVLQSIVESACDLCGASDAVVLLRDGDDLRFRAHHGPIEINIEKWPISRDWAAGRAFLDQATVHLTDIFSEQATDFTSSRELSRHTGGDGIRTVLSVPLLREGESVGAITLRRQEVNPFSEKQITLLQTYADQAVIAIGNVRLFEQVQQRTRELAASLDDLRAAQDRLVQTEKLASLGQLTAGIAHEIKNPLNFVNNFSALSAELTDELNDMLRSASLGEKMREDVHELTSTLKGNLEKVVQHGRRADAIVKNMLLHSREGSGEHRPTDINALLDDSLNLAYHGARAENSGFNITLQRNFDPGAGTVEAFPQEITRAFLNLISNGFYAATKRKTEKDDSGLEPILSVTTKNLGSTVEIRIRDNGTGISAEVKEKMFNPFFTTKPAGEGTGLGLSMSHDIIVKQHGGRIDVETELGLFTEFKIVLPRTSQR
jgi:two-component system, NtrC family, sensor kinase